MRKRLVFLLGMLVVCLQLLAQTRTITGRIVDAQGAGVPNASVTIKGTNTGTVTNAEGNFSLTVPNTARALVVSSIGFQNQEVTLNSTSNNIAITLGTAERALDEIVVTGYSRERKSQFAGAASIVSGKAVETVPVGSFDQALQGRAPGLLVNSGSGQPGSSATVTIRGVQSIQGAGAQPLYVIDGVPLPAFDMQSINPNDFESITVLKDANAAAIYGARGGTGVIVITTKKGRAGATNFQVRSQVGVTQAPDFSRLNLMNTEEILQYEERLKLAGTPGWNYSKQNPTYATASATEKARRDFLLDSIRGINSDWSDILYRQGVSQSHEINMSGGSEKTRFYISGGLFDQEGIDLGSSLKRYTTRFNIDHTTNRLSVQFNNAVGYSITNLSEGEWLGNSPRNPFQMTYRAKPYENPYAADGSLIYGASTNLALKQVGNLLEGVENSIWRQNQLKINSGLTVAFKVVEAVTLKNTVGIDFAGDQVSRYVNPGSYIGSLQTFASGRASESYRSSAQLINTSSAVYSQRIKEIHEVEAGAYFEIVRGFQKGLGFDLYNLDPRLTETGQGSRPLPVAANQTTYPQNSSSAKSGFGIRSYFGTLRYTFDNRYTINANVRRDGTSRIANEANREITTWSAGAIWNALQESFMENQNIFSDLRVRASYGIVPNIGSIATGSYGAGLVSVTNYQGPQVPSFGAATYAGTTIGGLVPTTPGNPNLAIEKIKKLNFGIDFSVWNNRARFQTELYQNKTVDLFVRQPLPAESGFGNLDINAGIMTNKGFEITANVDIVRNKDILFTVGMNHSINKNEIVDLGLVEEYFLGTFIIKKGLPYGTHYTTRYLGADPATGRPMFEAEDGKTVYDAAQAGQFYDFGTYLPKHVGGFTAELNYKGFTIDALFSYQFDVVRSNNTRNWITRGTPGYHTSVNASRELLDNQWQKPGDQAFYQAPNFDRQFSSSDLEDAKFLRFRNLRVAYQIPTLRLGGAQVIKGARVYVQGQNLAIWSPWRGVDPEDNNNISLNEYPNPRMFVAGIDINF